MFLNFILIALCFMERAVSQCSTPETLFTCYKSYLEKYGIFTDGYLPPFGQLLEQVKSHDLHNLCRDFNDLTSCFGSASTYCVSIANFGNFLPMQYQRDSINYLQNHAFFEFACGAGNELFRQNENCIQRSLAVTPLTNRMAQCGQSELPVTQNELCPATLEVTNCVRNQITAACGQSAGTAACGAAVNIERRLDFLDAACITEMDVRCGCATLYTLITFLIIFILQL